MSKEAAPPILFFVGGPRCGLYNDRMLCVRAPAVLFFVTILLWGGRGLAQPQPTPEEQFELARAAFEYQDYDKVIGLLEPLLNPVERLATKEMVLQAREWLGSSLWFKEDKVGFKAEFSRLLKESPDFELDTFYYPPDMVADFKKLKDQLIELEIIGPGKVDPPVEFKPVTKTVTLVTTIERPSPVLNFIPFGCGQFANGRVGKGVVFLSAQALFLGANMGSWLYLYSAQPTGTARDVALGAMYGSLAAFAGFYAWSVFDAWSDWEPERVLEEKRLENAEESASMWQVLPWPVAGGGIGLSVGAPF